MAMHIVNMHDIQNNYCCVKESGRTNYLIGFQVVVQALGIDLFSWFLRVIIGVWTLEFSVGEGAKRSDRAGGGGGGGGREDTPSHWRRKLDTDNKVGGAHHCLQTMGAPPSFIVRAERSAAHAPSDGRNLKMDSEYKLTF